MQSRILLITPNGPLCFVDYLTVGEGKAVLEQLKEAVDFNRLTNLFYEFRLLRMMKDKLISIDRLLLPASTEKASASSWTAPGPLPSYNSSPANKNPITTDTITATKPGLIKLWLTRYFPTRVVPVLSNSIAATSVG